MSTPFACFVTGTDTDVGKTLISAALLHTLSQQGLRCAGMKPVAAGAEMKKGVWRNSDVDALAQASSVKLPTALTAPYLLKTPASPHIAASQDGVTFSHARIADCYRQIRAQADAIVVEGVGGFRVPLLTTMDSRYDTADMAVQFGLPVVLVVGMRLGCLNHALLTADAIAAHQLNLAGWVANTIDPAMPYFAENVAALQTLLPAPLMGVIPYLQNATAVHAAAHLDFSCLPAWPRR
jgi:dethiobiotin synthetase